MFSAWSEEEVTHMYDLQQQLADAQEENTKKIVKLDILLL